MKENHLNQFHTMNTIFWQLFLQSKMMGFFTLPKSVQLPGRGGREWGWGGRIEASSTQH